jgi:hypothetical protein
MPFPQKEVDKLLAKCHRRCCICHRFCGVKIETDHIEQEGEGGSNEIENAIALCFECHAEVHLYNDKHPRGRKYHPNELKLHKEQWLEICEKSGDRLSEPLEHADGGPLSGLLTELEFNQKFTDMDIKTWGCPLETYQFQRAVSDGILSLLDDSLRDTIMDTYSQIKMLNHHQEVKSRHHPADTEFSRRAELITSLTSDVFKSIPETIQKLNDFLAQK